MDVHSCGEVNISIKPDEAHNVVDVDIFCTINIELAFRFDVMIDNALQAFPTIKHVAITLCGYGYNPDVLFAMINKLDKLKATGYTISIIITGAADLVTAALCCAGATPGHRYMAPNTIITIEPFHHDFAGSAKALQDHQVSIDLQHKFVNKIFKDSSMNATDVDEMLSSGVHTFSPQQAVAKGLVDKVVIRIPKIKKSSSKKK